MIPKTKPSLLAQEVAALEPHDNSYIVDELLSE